VSAPTMQTETDTEERGLPRDRRAGLGRLGLALLSATMLLFLGLVLTTMPEEAGFVVPPALIIVILTLLAWRLDATWVRVLGVIGTLGLAAMMFWVVFGLAHPSSFFDFVPAVTFVLGVALSLIGNVGAIARRKRRGAAPEGHGRGTGRLATAAVAIVVAAVVGSGALALLTRETVDPAIASGATVVDMSGFAFAPTLIEASAGTQLVVHNSDAFVHDFTVPDLDLVTTVLPGSDAVVDLPETPGTYVVYCTLHSDTSDPAPDVESNMVARLTVR
jgi:plastocyanin